MATFLENLTTRKNAIGVELAAMTTTAAGGKPDSAKGGIQHTAYRLSLYEELKEIDAKIALLAGDGGGVFETATEIDLG